MDLLKLPYPIFKTTPEERELLRRCEFWYVENPDSFKGLCYVLRGMSWFNSEAYNILSDKVLGSWFFMDFDLFGVKYQNMLNRLSYSDGLRIRSAVRRIWINKLLAYTGE